MHESRQRRLSRSNKRKKEEGRSPPFKGVLDWAFEPIYSDLTPV